MIKLLLTLILGVIGGLLGAYGGAENTSKGWRRVGVPILLGSVAFISGLTTIGVAISMIALWFVLSIGYGIPEPSDAGSLLGRFWYEKCDYDGEEASLMTQFTLAVLEVLAMIGFSRFDTWLEAVFFFTMLIIGAVAFRLKLPKCKYGTFKLFNKELGLEEFMRYLVVSLIGLGLILLWKTKNLV